MDGGADPHPRAPPRRGSPPTAQEALDPSRSGNPQPITDRHGPPSSPLEDVATGSNPASRDDVVSRSRGRGRGRRSRRSGAGSQASSSAAPPATNPDSPARPQPPTGGSSLEQEPDVRDRRSTLFGQLSATELIRELDTRGASEELIRELRIRGFHEQYIQHHLRDRQQQILRSHLSSDHPGAEGRIRVRQSVLYSDRPRHSRQRRLARAEEHPSVVSSSELHRPVTDLPTFEALSLSDPSLTTLETAEMTNDDYAPGSNHPGAQRVGTGTRVRQSVLYSDQPIQSRPRIPASEEEHTCDVSSTPQVETGEESDDDCTWLPTPGQSEIYFNRPSGLTRSMVLSEPLFMTVSNVKEQRPKPYSDLDPAYMRRMVKEYLDGRPCINLTASCSILAIEDPTLNAHAAELGTEAQPPSVISEQASAAAAHPQHSTVSTESRHEASAEETIQKGMTWMDEEVMMCFKKFVDINPDLAELKDYHLEELKHQCFNVESYDMVYHHYNFTVRMKMPDSADWKVELYFAEVKEIFRRKYYLCYPLEPNENGQCYACKNQGVDELRHPAIDLFEMGSPDASPCNLWYTDDE